MNCPHCGQTLEVEEEYFGRKAECPSCGKGIGIPDPKALRSHRKKWKHALVIAAVVLGVIGFVRLSKSGGISANSNAVAEKGSRIFIAIDQSNAELERLGLGDLWPKTYFESQSTNEHAIGQTAFTNSSQYFWALYDGDNLGKHDYWAPYVAGFDLSLLAGGGVGTSITSRKLRPENNMWAVLANFRDDDNDCLPILVTRNVAVSALASAINSGLTYKDFDTPVSLGRTYRTPLGYESAVIIRKSGKAEVIREGRSTLGNFFGGEVLEKRSADKVPVKYLTP